MADVRNDFDSVASICNTFVVPKAPVQFTSDTLSFLQSIGLNPDEAGSFGLVVTSKVFSASQQDMNDSSKIVDFYMLTHDFELNPSVTSGIGGYDISIEPFDNPDTDGVYLSWSANALMDKSQPETTESMTNYSATLSSSLSGNIGAFGATGTGGFGYSSTTSNTISTNVPDVKVRNSPTGVNSQNVFISFTIAKGASVGTASFQPTIQHLHQCVDISPDSKRSDKPEDVSTAATVCFKLSVAPYMYFEADCNGGESTVARLNFSPFLTIIKVRVPPRPSAAL